MSYTSVMAYVRKSTAGWLTIGNKRIYFRSSWEKKYALYLNFLHSHGYIKEWSHEPKTFWFLSIKRGVRSYLPDFLVLENDLSHHWIEVKGFFDARSKTKIKRFAKYYPQEELRIIDGKWFKENSMKLKMIVKGWML